MGRKSKETLIKEYKKARSKYLRYIKEYSRCHPTSKRYSDLQEKTIMAEEACVLLNRKIYNWSPGNPDKLV